MDYPRRELVNHVLGHKNICLLTSRQQATIGYRHCWVAENPANDCVISTTSREANQIFPLYLYPDPNDRRLLDAEGEWPPGKDGRTPNLSKAFITELAAQIGLTFVTDGRGDLAGTFGPEDVFHYAYAVFHSPTYRERYAEFLKIDFPRLPLTSDAALFKALCEKGSALVEAHLLRGTTVGLRVGFPESGDNVVASGYPKYVPTHQPPDAAPGEGEEQGRVYINATQYFEGVPEAVWDFHIGGYQVMEKWLKDRRGRALRFEDVRHYQRVAGALAVTIRLMDEIDELIPGWPLA
jgi:hypothetical protein